MYGPDGVTNQFVWQHGVGYQRKGIHADEHN